MTTAELKLFIKNAAVEMGFIDSGVSKLRKLAEEEGHLKQWLSNGFHGKMQYMENHLEKRLNPELLVPGAKIIISFLYNYFPQKLQNEQTPKIAKYAYGEDYHRVIKDKLFALSEQIIQQNGSFHFRIFVDSAPVMERQWAALSGLGWIGKNSLLLRQGVGSFFFIANIICDLELEPDAPVTDHCGTCTACIDACPTDAIVAESVVDASKCISYLTIESKDDIPEVFQNKMEGWSFGCDICQDVCPWNRFSTPTDDVRFQPQADWLTWEKEEWHPIGEEKFHAAFEKSALQRAGLNKLQKSIDFSA